MTNIYKLFLKIKKIKARDFLHSFLISKWNEQRMKQENLRINLFQEQRWCSGHDGGSDDSNGGLVPTLLVAGSPLHTCAPRLPCHHLSPHFSRWGRRSWQTWGISERLWGNLKKEDRRARSWGWWGFTPCCGLLPLSCIPPEALRRTSWRRVGLPW